MLPSPLKKYTIMNRREILRYAAYATGMAVTAPFASAFLVSCKRDEAVAAGVVAYVPTFFTAEEYQFISTFSDTILPKTDTPSASEVGVPEMIDKVVGQVYGAEAQTKTREGLTLLMQKLNAEKADGGFVAMEEAARLAFLQAQDDYFKNPTTDWEALGEEATSIKDAYFTLKQATISYYFTSEEVATKQLVYLPVPGPYIACGDLQELTGGKAWAIN